MPINARTLCGFLASFPRNLKQLNPSNAVLKAVVGVDAGHSRSRRRSATDVDLPLAGTHRPGSLHRFTKISGEFAAAQGADGVVGPYGEISMHSYPVGADDSVRPQTAPVLTGIYGESVAAQRADVGIGPYMTPANSCCPANFECKAFLQQILNRSYSQIWCTITGGAYQIARRVSTCVRNICKSDSCLNCTRRTHQTRPSAPFLPILFRQDGKEWAVGDIPQYHIPIKVPNQTGELP